MQANPAFGERPDPGWEPRRNHGWDYFGSDAYNAPKKRCNWCNMYARRSGLSTPLQWEYQAQPGGPFVVSASVPPCPGRPRSADEIAADVEREELMETLLSARQDRLAVNRREYAAITALRNYGATWGQIAAATGRRTPQGAQGYYRALRWRIQEAEDGAEDGAAPAERG